MDVNSPRNRLIPQSELLDPVRFFKSVVFEHPIDHRYRYFHPQYKISFRCGLRENHYNKMSFFIFSRRFFHLMKTGNFRLRLDVETFRLDVKVNSTRFQRQEVGFHVSNLSWQFSSRILYEFCRNLLRMHREHCTVRKSNTAAPLHQCN